ncbi:MAG: alpha/beta hydrolase family protein [Planctomycetota bacterium]|jgi:pimeloyl-ACP methyl ester carboxylesterase
MMIAGLLRAVLVLALLAQEQETPKPPGQPAEGPGGREYAHEKVTEHSVGEKGEKVWIFEPDGPKPAKAPVVVFCHGWSAVAPAVYRAWLDHLVRRGNIVVYPVYQAKGDAFKDFMPNAVTGVKAAVEELKKEGHVRPEPGKWALVGHSMGGVLCANLAATWEEHGLPKPAAVMPVQPGGGSKKGGLLVPYADYAKIPASALLLSVAGEDDKLVGGATAKYIYAAAKTRTTSLRSRCSPERSTRSTGTGTGSSSTRSATPRSAEKIGRSRWGTRPNSGIWGSGATARP